MGKGLRRSGPLQPGGNLVRRSPRIISQICDPRAPNPFKHLQLSCRVAASCSFKISRESLCLSWSNVITANFQFLAIVF